jgi:putative selenate reductase
VVRGPATVIKAVRDGQRIAETLLTRRQISVPRRPRRLPKGLSDGELLRRRAERQHREPLEERPAAERRDLEEVVGVMTEEAARQEAARCLVCNEMCSLCVTVCPNRANQAYEVQPTVRSMPAYRVGAGSLHELPGRVVRVTQRIQIVNLTNLCNECGNCATFCPTAGAPYRDKPRLHLDRESFAAERDRALLVEKVGTRYQIRARIAGEEHLLRQDGRTLSYQSPRLAAVLDTDDLGVLEARPGPEAVEGDVLGLEVALHLNVILIGLTRSLPHLL